MRFHRFPPVFRYTLGAGRGAFALAVCLLIPLSAAGQVNPVPFVNQPLVPTAVAPGGPDFTLTVNGTGFVPDSVVNWNGSPRPTTFVSNSQLTAAIPATDITVIGSASVTVANPAPGGGVSNEVLFLITLPIPSVTFKRTDFGTSGGAIAVATADFNGDAIADVAVLRDYEVLIFVGNGDGTVQSQRSFPTGGSSGSARAGIAAADLNKDGRFDLAVTNFRSNEDSAQGSISVLLGNGDGTLRAAVNYPVPGFYPTQIVSADFNADGALDLAVPGRNSGGGAVGLLLGRGDGTFLPASQFTAGGGTLYSAAAADFNGDGTLDVAVPTSQRDLSIFLGNSDGTFVPGASITVYGPDTVRAADFNGDGKLDLAVGSYETSSYPAGVRILRGVGDGTFQWLVNYNVGSPFEIIAADFQGDGNIDLLISRGGGFSVLAGTGTGTFGSPGTSYSGTSGPTSFVAADFDDDGRVDVASGNQSSPVLSVFMQPSPVDLDPKRLSFGDQLVGTPSSSGTATLTNNLTGPLTISSIALTGTSAADFTETNDCPLSPSTLAAGGSCTITVTFDHTTLGEKTAAVTVSDDAPGYPQQVLNLTGAVVNPTATLSSTSLNFGNQPIDVTSAAQTVTITNSGVGALTILGITVTGDFAVTNNCGTRLAQGAQCVVSVTFTPTNPGTRFGIVTISDNAATSPQMISLVGTGVPPTVTPSTTSLTFGSQHVGTSSAPQTVTLTNNGPGPLTVTSVAPTAEFSELDNCIGTVAASASCTISVYFTPTANGTRTGTLTINDNAVGSPQTVSLRGTGLGPEASISPSSLNFPNQSLVTTSPPQTVTLTNSGAAMMTLSGILAISPFAETTNCTATLSAGASCAITVTFTPNVAGTTYGELIISDDAPGSPQTVALAGTGSDFSLAPAAGSSTSATVNAGQTATYRLTFTPESFSGTVAVTCRGAPARATCLVSPAPVTLDGTKAANVTVTVTTTARSLAGPRPHSWPPARIGHRAVPLAVWLLGLMVLLTLAAPRRRRVYASLPVSMLLVLLWAACGGGGGGGGAPAPQTGTPAGTYTLTITGTAAGVSRTTSLTLKVN